MQIEIERVVQKLALNEYAPEYGDKCLHVWVNPARKIMQRRIEQSSRGQELRGQLEALMTNTQPETESIARAREIAEEMYSIGRDALFWMSEILSQGPEESRVTLEELTQLVASCDELDPRFYGWICARVWQMIADYRAMKKKA